MPEGKNKATPPRYGGIRGRVRRARNVRSGMIASGRGVNPGERPVGQTRSALAELPKATGKRARTDKNRKQIAGTYKYQDVTGTSKRNKPTTKKGTKNPKR